jgi:hypothetical protein
MFAWDIYYFGGDNLQPLSLARYLGDVIFANKARAHPNGAPCSAPLYLTPGTSIIKILGA